MADSSTPLELVEAYRLIKAGQRQEAGVMLKAYLAQNGRDPKAWWLMAHAVDKPENVRRCLETVLKIDPNHAKAREKLARLTAPPTAPGPTAPAPAAAPPPPASTPPFVVDSSPAQVSAPPPAAAAPALAAAPTPVAGDEPDNSFFGVNSTAPVVPAGRASKPMPAGRASKPLSALNPVTPEAMPAGRASKPISALNSAPAASAPPPSFEDYAANSTRFDDPFATHAADDPFADIPAQPSPGIGGGASPGVSTGIPMPPKPTGAAWGEDFAAPPTRHGLERAIGFVVVAFALLVALGLILVVADRQGLIQLGGGDKVPKMTALDGGTFQIDYPKNWDMRCLSDVSGYPVCGIANHPLYNEVDYYAGTVNLGLYISESMGSLLGGGDLPEQQVSIIVMDVPRTSPSYDDASLAKTLYEWDQEWMFSFDKAKTHYDHKETTVDGLKAYYYEYTSEGNMNEAAWDVYVEHDGIILWMRVSFFGPRRADIPHNMVEDMIQSIHFKSGEPM